MLGYWIRHRLLGTLVICIMTGLIAGFLFVIPYVSQKANDYNSKSIYNNSKIDFIAPEPSFDQVQELPGTNGIAKVFPFYLTKSQVAVKESSRTTTILFSDQLQNIDFTMYNDGRLIKKSDVTYNRPIIADWKFCQETGTDIGDTVEFLFDGVKAEYQISAIYETNTIYDEGTLLVKISEEQREAIRQKSNNNGYSGMYISASDYSICKTFLTTDYRPMGRLKSREEFGDEDQYQVHYDAIMSSGYANEITDFNLKRSESVKQDSSWTIWIGACLAAMLILVFNIMMFKRGCETTYFRKNCIPKGRNVKPYYSKSFGFELVLFLVVYVAVLFVGIMTSKVYFPKSIYGFELTIIPGVVIIIEIFCYIINTLKVSGWVRAHLKEVEKMRKNELEKSEQG